MFSQVLVGGKSSAETSKQGVLIEKRNEHVMNVLHKSLQILEQGKEFDIINNSREQNAALSYSMEQVTVVIYIAN